MKEEEKKALEVLYNLVHINTFVDLEQKEPIKIPGRILKKWQSNIKIIVNLIDNQQKEIVRLQNILKRDILQDLISIEEVNIYKNYISKDRIKEKINILEKLQKEFLNNDEIEIKIIAYKELLGD